MSGFYYLVNSAGKRISNRSKFLVENYLSILGNKIVYEETVVDKNSFENKNLVFVKDDCQATIKTEQTIWGGRNIYYSHNLMVIGNDSTIVKQMVEELSQILHDTLVFDWEKFYILLKHK